MRLLTVFTTTFLSATSLLCTAFTPAMAVEIQKAVDEKDLYNFWFSPGYLWAFLSFVLVVVVVLVAFRYEKQYLDENRPEKNIKLEE